MKICLNENNLKEAADWLAMQDPRMALVLEKYGYPPLWARTPGFATLIHIILEQQVSLASALAAFRRLEEALGEITPAGFLTLREAELLKIGFSRQKKGYARELAQALVEERFAFDTWNVLPDAELREQMKKLKGVGDWTVDIYALMCLLRPDVLPKGDIALYEAYRSLYGLSMRPDYAQFLQNTLHWQPWRSVGARMLWHFYLCESKQRRKIPKTQPDHHNS